MVHRHTETELVALCDIRSKEEVGVTGFDVPFSSRTWRTMLAQVPGIDVVNVCTPNGLARGTDA
jgi:UDP-N-acetyl-2-amino-2-deoxyglucuronate dehydrogenase